MFQSASQEIYMAINMPDLWKRWVKKYGHAAGYQALLRKKKRKKGSVAKKSKRKHKR
jgi:hypothetical protein